MLTLHSSLLPDFATYTDVFASLIPCQILDLVGCRRSEVFFTYRVSCHRGHSKISSLCLAGTYTSTETFMCLVWKLVDPMATQAGVAELLKNATIHQNAESFLRKGSFWEPSLGGASCKTYVCLLYVLYITRLCINSVIKLNWTLLFKVYKHNLTLYSTLTETRGNFKFYDLSVGESG